MNYHNLAQKSNFIGGSDKFPLIPFYLTTLNIPGITFNLPEVGGRYSTKVFLPSDKLTFNNLSFEFLIDENFELYKDFMSHIFNIVDTENGTFKNEPFTFWIQLNNNKGNKLINLEFYNCRIENIGDINLTTTDDESENTLSLELRYDYYSIISENIPSL